MIRLAPEDHAALRQLQWELAPRLGRIPSLGDVIRAAVDVSREDPAKLTDRIRRLRPA